jgi:hypothetical protein
MSPWGTAHALQLVGAGAKIARAVGWLLAFTRPAESPIFDVEWRYYDAEPGDYNAVGRALFKRAWAGRRVIARWVRTKERSGGKDTLRYYKATGLLRDRRLVLAWTSEDRPDTFGALVLSVDEDCKEMIGYTILTPQDTAVTEARRIWFRK